MDLPFILRFMNLANIVFGNNQHKVWRNPSRIPDIDLNCFNKIVEMVNDFMVIIYTIYIPILKPQVQQKRDQSFINTHA